MTKVTMPEPFLLVADQPWGGHAEVIPSARGGDGVIDCYTAAQMEAYAAAKVREVLDAAADVIKKKWVDYDNDCGSTDPETGAREYPREGAEYVCEMQDLEDEIRALIPHLDNECPPASQNARHCLAGLAD